MSVSSARPKPLVLAILDGWGHRGETEDNAIAAARPPVWDALWRDCPHSLIDASEGHVGLPEGQMGNSEVGHMNIGAGRVVLQDLPRIDAAIRDGTLAENPALQRFIAALKRSGGACHLLGLLSGGGVHSHMEHMAALAEIVAASGVQVYVHAFLDGRDTPPRSAEKYLERWETRFSSSSGRVTLATLSGRYYAMDRDRRWERVEKAYRALAEGAGVAYPDAASALRASYAAGVTDEFLLPCALGEYAGRGMQDGDGLLMANFRADRAREMLHALLDQNFEGFGREPRSHALPLREGGRAGSEPGGVKKEFLIPPTHPPLHSPRERGEQEEGGLPLRGGVGARFSAILGMVEYSEALNLWIPAMFPPEQPAHTLGEVLAGAGLKQLRIAETEKYAHVTFFLNGGREEPFPGESRILVPSPKVATYDLQPEMSACEVTDRLVEAIEAKTYDAIIVNYANADMVGHTGNFAAAVQAVEALDACLGRLLAAVEAQGGVLMITADHGNIESMRDASTGQAHTAHTLLRVPLVIAGGGAALQSARLADGRLADIAPTALALLGLPQPKEMTGRNLLRHGTI